MFPSGIGLLDIKEFGTHFEDDIQIRIEASNRDYQILAEVFEIFWPDITVPVWEQVKDILCEREISFKVENGYFGEKYAKPVAVYFLDFLKLFKVLERVDRLEPVCNNIDWNKVINP